MAIEIKRKWTGETIRTVEADSLSGADLRWADLRWANLSGANLSRADLPPIEVVPQLKSQILSRINAEGCSLDMSDWHQCETTHCLAGWATVLHPQGRLLESLLDTNAAGALIFNACCGEVPDFFSSNEAAMEWLKKVK